MSKLIFVCSPFRDTNVNRKAANVNLAHTICRHVIQRGYLPLTPHIYFPQFLDDNDATERELGINYGLAALEMCDEVWVWGQPGEESEGMLKEVTHAKQFMVPVKYQAEWLPKGTKTGAKVLAFKPPKNSES